MTKIITRSSYGTNMTWMWKQRSFRINFLQFGAAVIRTCRSLIAHCHRGRHYRNDARIYQLVRENRSQSNLRVGPRSLSHFPGKLMHVSTCCDRTRTQIHKGLLQPVSYFIPRNEFPEKKGRQRRRYFCMEFYSRS